MNRQCGHCIKQNILGESMGSFFVRIDPNVHVRLKKSITSVGYKSIGLFTFVSGWNRTFTIDIAQRLKIIMNKPVKLMKV